MIDMSRRFAQAAMLAVAAMLPMAFAAPAAEPPKTQSLWFDPTQLPSFTGVVDRFLPNPEGHVDRLIFKEGSQIVFPPDAFDAIREIAPIGRPLVVWGIRARSAPVITMLAFAQPDTEPTVLDRFYWRPERGEKQGRRDLMLIGTVRAPFLSPQGQTAGAILQNGDVIQIDPSSAGGLKDRFAAGAKIVAEGPGMETPFGKAIEADRVGDTVATLERVPRIESASGPHAQDGAAGTSRPRQ